MCWFCGKPKTALQLMEEELIRQHSAMKSGDWETAKSARERIAEINKIFNEAAKVQINQKLEDRLKSIEDAISDLYLLGKDDGKTNS